MLQSYLVTERDNKRLNSNKEVFEWLVTVFDHAISGKPWHHCKFAVIEVIKVREFQCISLTWLKVTFVSAKS